MKSFVLFAALIIECCQVGKHLRNLPCVIDVPNKICTFRPDIFRLLSWTHTLPFKLVFQYTRVTQAETTKEPNPTTAQPTTQHTNELLFNSHTTVVHHATQAHTDLTDHHGPTREPDEREFFVFYYDHYSHQMILKQDKSCYIFALSSQERANVHTNTGMRALELKLLALLNFATKTLVQPSTLNAHIRSACGMNIANYYTMS